MYIIDANNLAGRLKMLGEENFDRKLRDLAKLFIQNKKSKIVLVFDSNDPMGDKRDDGGVISIYTPKDKYYKDADDKIAEIAERELNLTQNGFSSRGEEITVVTDDGELIKRIDKINENSGARKARFMEASEFASKLKKMNMEKKENGKRGLHEEEIDRINRELLKIWK